MKKSNSAEEDVRCNSTKTGVPPQPHYLPARWFGGSYLLPLDLRALICKMGIIISTSSRPLWGINEAANGNQLAQSHLCYPRSISMGKVGETWDHISSSFSFLGSHPRHLEVPRLRVVWELQLPAYATATATTDPSCVCNLHHSS